MPATCPLLLSPLLLVGMLLLSVPEQMSAEEPAAGTIPRLASPANAGDAPAPASKPEPPSNPIHSYLNTNDIAFIKSSAAKRGLAAQEVGTGRVRCLELGGVSVDMTKPLAIANLCLDGLETLTGDQETFILKQPADGERYYLVIFASSGQVCDLIDDGRNQHVLGQPAGEDLLKKHPAFPMARCSIASLDQLTGILNEYAAYSITVDCLDAFYRAHDPKLLPPTWLREGLACDLQQITCHDIRCTTIAYEDKVNPSSSDWAGDIRHLLASGSPQNKEAEELMGMPLDALPNVFYQQMWSLATYVRMSCGVPQKGKGATSKLRKLLDLTATGTSSMPAVKQVFGRGDPQLTRAWRTWAADFKN